MAHFLTDFLQTGNIEAFLKNKVEKSKFSPGKQTIHNQKKGRPLFSKLEEKKNLVIMVRDIEGIEASKERLEEIVEDIEAMLNQYEVGNYAFTEFWYSRLGSPGSTDATLTEMEKTAILEGSSDKFQKNFRVLFLLRKVKEIEIWRYTIRLGNFEMKRDLPAIKFEKLNPTIITEDPDYDILNIGLDFGAPFEFPKLLESVGTPYKIAFIDGYNEKVLDMIDSLKTNTISDSGNTELWKAFRRNCFQEWINLIQKAKKISLKNWTTENKDFDINTITRNTADMCSCFTWWNKRNVDFIPFTIQSDNSDVTESVDGEKTDYGLYRDRKMLIPRMEVSSYKRIKSQIKFQGDLKVSSTKTVEYKGLKATNPYPLLAGAGSQSIELANLASILGSGCHNSAALNCIQKNHDIPTAIANTEFLDQYLQAMPAITHLIGEKLVAQNNDYIAAVEFPIYHFDPMLPTGVCYTRIDAITMNFRGNNFKNGDVDESFTDTGFSVWEYKTRWGSNVNISQKANKDDANQAFYYCWRLKAMTGYDIKSLYVVYVHVINHREIKDNSDRSNINDTVDLKVYIHRYKIDDELFNSISIEDNRR